MTCCRNVPKPSFFKSSEDVVSFPLFEGKFLDWERQETLRDDFYTLQTSQNGEFLIFRVFLVILRRNLRVTD